MAKKNDYEELEKAEEALAEKNINEAERILNKEKNVDKESEYDEYEDLSLEDRIINIEKKVTAILWLVVITMIVAILSLIFVISDDTTKSESDSDTTSTTETESSAEYDVSKFKEIKAQDLEKESKGKTIIVYIGRSTCGYCVQFVPVLKEVQEKYSYTTYYIDIAKILDYTKGGTLDDKANKIMQNFATTDDQKDVMKDWGATPMTLVIKNNKIVDSLVGAADSSTLETIVKNNGLAK